MNTKELPELLDPNNLPSQELNEQQNSEQDNPLVQQEQNKQNEVTITLTTDEDTLRAMELLFSPNLSELKENQPEMFQYYSLFGAAEGIIQWIIPCWLSYTPSLIIHSVSRLNKFRLVLLFHLLYKQYDAVG